MAERTSRQVSDRYAVYRGAVMGACRFRNTLAVFVPKILEIPGVGRYYIDARSFLDQAPGDGFEITLGATLERMVALDHQCAGEAGQN